MNINEIVIQMLNTKTNDEKLFLLDQLEKQILEQDDLDINVALTYLERIFKLKTNILNQKNYSIQMIRKIIQNIKEEKKKKWDVKISIGCGNFFLNDEMLYGIFGLDDTFCLAESRGIFFNTGLYLNDVITDTKLTPIFKRNNIPWKSGVIDIFGVKSYAVPFNKLINEELSNIEDAYLLEVNNKVNSFLGDNKGFVKEVFEESKTYKK